MDINKSLSSEYLAYMGSVNQTNIELNTQTILSFELCILVSVFVELPISVVQRTHLSSFKPSRYTVKVKGVVTDPPGYCTLLTGSRGLVSLTLNTGVHDMVPTDGTVVHYNVPSP